MKIYSGQSISEVEEVELAQNVCYELTNKLFNEGRTLYADNFYMSYELALQFLNLKTYSVGELYDTIKKSIPKDVIDYPLKKGETVSLEDNNGIVSKGKMFSTKYAPIMVPSSNSSTRHRWATKLKPVLNIIKENVA
ncbi:piggybac transposable element-derived protein 4-like protein [Lasius niger]|uniref:Piggybac transposable element-derived protein 4-like protein n=1 Tax=Lasius niger TaxID=67767 RepID=A0A0J7K5R0_LASNI|nr:piggybac transposable element-derived protein 4-like protein [Lasius niger]